MLIIDDEALILDSSPFRDRHLLVSALTREHGSIRAVLRNARGGKRPAGAATQVLSLVRLGAHQKAGAEMFTIRHVDLERSSFPLAATLPAAAAASVASELLLTFCPPAEPAPRRFRLGLTILEALLDGIEPEVAVSYGQYWMLSLSGLLPSLDRCSACGSASGSRPALRRSDGQPLCPDCLASSTDSLGDHDLRFLLACHRRHLNDVPGPVPPLVAVWLDLLARIEAERPLRALDFFREHAT